MGELVDIEELSVEVVDVQEFDQVQEPGSLNVDPENPKSFDWNNTEKEGET